MLVIFLAGWFYFTSRVKNTSVYLKDSTLQVFDDSIPFMYPDNLELHGDYILIVQPEKQKTQIVNLKTRKTEKIIDKALLDYADGKMLYNKGAETYVDEKALGVLCEQGIIKNTDEILCLTKESSESTDYSVVNIVSGKEPTNEYSSSYLITDIAYISGKLYVGEIDSETKQSYIAVNGKGIPVPGVVNMIYEMNGDVYYASFKSALSKENAYYLFSSGGTKLINNSEILFADL